MKLTGIWYLCHPLAGDIEGNRAKAAELARQLAAEHPEAVIFSPLAAFSWLREPEDRAMALRYCMAILELPEVQGIILPPGWGKSWGCCMEHKRALELEKMVHYLGIEEAK